jgi:hypothetical protein
LGGDVLTVLLGEAVLVEDAGGCFLALLYESFVKGYFILLSGAPELVPLGAVVEVGDTWEALAAGFEGWLDGEGLVTLCSY